MNDIYIDRGRGWWRIRIAGVLLRWNPSMPSYMVGVDLGDGRSACLEVSKLEHAIRTIAEREIAALGEESAR